MRCAGLSLQQGCLPLRLRRVAELTGGIKESLQANMEVARTTRPWRRAWRSGGAGGRRGSARRTVCTPAWRFVFVFCVGRCLEQPVRGRPPVGGGLAGCADVHAGGAGRAVTAYILGEMRWVSPHEREVVPMVFLIPLFGLEG